MRKNPVAAFYILPFFIVFNSTISAQLRPVYTFQKDDTSLRRNFYEVTMAKKKESIKSVGKLYADDYKWIYENHYNEIGSLWKSNSTVTEPTAFKYLQSIVEKIIS